MKIAMVSSYNIASHGGVQRHIRDLARAFAADGAQVDIFAPASASAHTTMPPGVSLRPVRFPNLTLNLNGAPLNMNLGILNAIKVVNTIRRNNYTVMHVHEPLQPITALWSALHAPVPTVATWHSHAEKQPWGLRLTRNAFNKRLTRMAQQDISIPIAVSTAAASTAAKYLPAKFRIIPNPVNPHEFKAPRPAPPNLNPNHFNILFVGRLDAPRKGLRTLLGAYSLLKYSHPNIRITVIGAGQPEPQARSTLSERGLDNIAFLGPASRETLIAHYQHANLLCAPATGSESFGIILAEAIAANLPIVASNINGYRQLADDSDILFAKPLSESAWAAAIEQVIRNPQAAKKRAAHARRHIHNISLAKVAKLTLQAYQDAITIHTQRRQEQQQ